MFKVEFFIDDRRLGDVLRALAASGARGVTPTPVINAAPEPGTKGVKAQARVGNITELFLEHLHKTRPHTITPDEVLAWVKSHGRGRHSRMHVVRSLIRQKVLSPVGRRNQSNYHYTVNLKAKA